MEGLFKAKHDKAFEKLDFSEIPEEERRILFQDKKYDPAVQQICRLPVEIVPVHTRRKTSRFRRRKGYENVTIALVWATIVSPGLKLLGILPNSTSVDGGQDNTFSEDAIIGIKVPPFVNLQLSGKAEQSFRQKQRSIIAARTGSEAQWAFDKLYLKDNLGFTLVFLFERQDKTKGGQVRIKLSFMDRGRDIYSPKPKVIAVPS